MAQRSKVPKFGNWEGEENIPYTVYFDKARKDRGGRMINPNDPEENPEAFSNDSIKPPVKTTDSPHHGDHGEGFGEIQKKAARQSGGPDRSIEQSPLHPYYQAKVGGKGSGGPSPSRERRNSSEGGHGYGSTTPGRSRLGPRGDETPERGATVPKFGEWDEKNPSSADGYTDIFNKVKEEKQGAAVRVPQITRDSSFSYGQRPKKKNSKKCGCFPWG